jgi:hypothetical protein
MNQSGIQPSFLSCLVIEPDAASRWMLSFLLQNSARVQIVAECESLEIGLVRLDALRTTSRPVQVVLLGTVLETADALAPVVDAIGRFAPEVAIVVLGQLPASVEVVRALGVAGYWWKRDRPEALLEILMTLHPAPILAKPSRVVVSPAIAALGRLSRSTDYSLGGIGEIDARFSTFDRTLAQLDFELRSQRLNRPKRWFLQGRIREILAARWVAQQLLSKRLPKRLPSWTAIGSDPQQRSVNAPPAISQRRIGMGRASQPSASNAPNQIFAPQTVANQTTANQSRSLSRESDRLSMIFDQFIVKLDAARSSPLGALDNLSPLPLEIDLLDDTLKVKLLSLTAQVLQAETQALRSEALGLAALHDRVPLLLETVWSVVLTQFFRADLEDLQSTNPQATSPQATSPQATSPQASSRLESLLKSRATVNQLLLRRIPLVADWMAYAMLDIPLSLENQPYAPGTPQADRRALLLLESTIISLANAVLQPLLNQFSEVETIKRRYFHLKYASSRELARFRNDLSWRYRRDRWLDTPTDIFESQYRVYHLSPQGITETRLYAPRQRELHSLAGLPLAITLVLETRDALAPRLKATFALIGTGVVYLLTEVVGRGIGLVGQGIVKGIGNAWQERR